MKKLLYSLLIAFGAIALVACSDDEGTNPGHDGTPVVTIYQYTPGDGYNPDNDVALRFVANNATKELYYLVEKTEDKEAYVQANGAAAYADYVIENGTKFEDASAANDVIETGMEGAYTITAVCVAGSKKYQYAAEFLGLSWTTIVEGTYYHSVLAELGLNPTAPTTLQKCDMDENLYRFKDVFKEGYHLKFSTLPDYTGEDDYGKYTFIRVEPQATPFTYGSYGGISVRDVGYWQNDTSYVTEGGFEGGIYTSGPVNDVFLCVQYYVSAGNLGYDYDVFEAAGGEGGDDTTGGEGGDDTTGGEGGDDTTGGEGGDDTTGGEGGDDTTGGEGGDDTTGGEGGDDTTGGEGGDDTTGGEGGDDTTGGEGGDDTTEGDTTEGDTTEGDTTGDDTTEGDGQN